MHTYRFTITAIVCSISALYAKNSRRQRASSVLCVLIAVIVMIMFALCLSCCCSQNSEYDSRIQSAIDEFFSQASEHLTSPWTESDASGAGSVLKGVVRRTAVNVGETGASLFKQH